MDLKRTLLGLVVVAASVLLSPSAEAQEPRTWTATSGHELKGTLVSFTKTEVTIKDLAGKLRSISRAKLSDYDKNYVMDFPRLETKATFTSKTRPRVNVRAIRPGNRKRHDTNLEITLSNRHRKDLEVEVLWVFYTPPPKTGSGSIIASKPTDLLPLEPKMTRVTVKALDEMKFQTQDARVARLSKGKAWESSMTITGYLVQVYTDGQLLNGFSSSGVLNDFAKDPGLLKKFKG